MTKAGEPATPASARDGQRSAADVPWREFLVRIYPYEDHAVTSVNIRRHRGGALVWDRHLGTHDLPLPRGADRTAAGILRAVSDALAQIADQYDRQ